MKDLWVTPTEQGLPLPLVPPEYPLPGLHAESIKTGVTESYNGVQILPTHALSGLPLLVLPLDAPNEYSQEWKDYDHGFYPRSKFVFRNQARYFGKAAVRCSRGQDLPRWLHERKHKVFPEGPLIPATRSEEYKVAVLACADFVPRQAIDLSPGNDYKIVNMTDTQLQELAVTRAVHIEDANHANTGTFYRNTIGKFFAFYAIEQDLSHMSPLVIDEFVHTHDSERKIELGNLLLAESVEVAVEPVRSLEKDLLEQGMVQLRRRDARTTVRKFFVKSRFKDYLAELQTNLVKAA